MKFKCNDCEEIFEDDEVEVISTSYEQYYGVTNDLPGRSPFTYMVCPYCRSEEIEEYEEEEDEYMGNVYIDSNNNISNNSNFK